MTDVNLQRAEEEGKGCREDGGTSAFKMSTHYEQLNDREIIELQRANILHVTWRRDKCERFTLSVSLPLSHLPLTSAGM